MSLQIGLGENIASASGGTARERLFIDHVDAALRQPGSGRVFSSACAALAPSNELMQQGRV